MLSIFILALLSCKDKSVNSETLSCDQVIISDDSLYEHSPNDSYEFKNVEIIHNCLNITIEYGGGCGEVEFNLIDSELVMESYPPQRNIKLSFKDEDYCKALIRKQVSFDLTPIQIIGINKVILHLDNWEKAISYTY